MTLETYDERPELDKHFTYPDVHYHDDDDAPVIYKQSLLFTEQ